MVLTAVLALGACGTTKRPGDVDLPRSGGGPGWLAPNGDLSNTRWVSGPIDAASVSRLARAWTAPMNAIATPIVSNGVVYTQELASTVYAIDLASGRVRWRSSFSEAEGNMNGGPNGIAIGDGRVYGATTRLAFALDAKTGRRVWVKSIVRNRNEGIGMAPGYADGTMIISTDPGASTYGGGERGTVWALDGATGRTKWTWATVPPDLWGHPELNSGGGLWHTPSFDGSAVYFGTGNPGPVPGLRGHPWGASRPGPNRWTNAIVKLDARTGRLLWARQPLPHDLYDWDLECPVILARAHGRPIAIAGGKMGFVYAFDRADGTLLWKRAVGLHNGHDDDNLRALRGTDRSRAPRRVLPGVLGGIETQMAADRDTVYAPVNNLWTVYRPEAIGATEGFGAATGEIVAIDLASGRVRWDRKLPSSVYGGATVVNDLVFTATYDGTIWALRTDTGAVAWRSHLPDGSNGPLGVAGDTLFATANIPFGNDQPIALLAYRLRR